MLPTSRLILNGGLKLHGLREANRALADGLSQTTSRPAGRRVADKCANVDPMARFVAIIAVVLTGHAFASTVRQDATL
jgi:hypothetical protein